MEVVVGSDSFLTVVTRSASGDIKYPLRPPTFKQIREYTKNNKEDGFDSLEKLLIQLRLPSEVVDKLSILDVNAISEKMVELMGKKK